ncbi:MAG: aryl-sulfate sulfotransferase [Bacteroidetes bacterium]|nr:aryl-sulfate sulfotransferase [Bacteroidota bacterium]
MNRFLKVLGFVYMLSLLEACSGSGSNIIKEIKIGLHNNNNLKIQIDVETAAPADVTVEYWADSLGEGSKLASDTSLGGVSHKIVFCNIYPNTNYSFHILTNENGKKQVSKTYHFTSEQLPMWLKDQFKYVCNDTAALPEKFKRGFMLMNKRETPGLAYIVDFKGRIRWYHMVDGTGFKVVHFTKNKTILSILGKNDEPTSYGSEILELNLLGDTVLYLKKGQGDLKYSIHHEIRENNLNQILTLYVDQRIMDLSSIGGKKIDTVKGDGILILDRKGKKVWQWSVFDVMDPLKDPQLLKTKNDWMHANSLSFDKDSNFLISFYNIGQIWKLDAHTGKIIWKLGKGGTMAMPAECDFTESHTVHINPHGDLMFFDNGVKKRLSEVFALKLNEKEKTAAITLHIKLPPDIYNDRMGSAYMITDTTILCCSSKRKITVLVNPKGVLLWDLETAIPPYRVDFLTNDQVCPWLQP